MVECWLLKLNRGTLEPEDGRRRDAARTRRRGRLRHSDCGVRNAGGAGSTKWGDKGFRLADESPHCSGNRWCGFLGKWLITKASSDEKCKKWCRNGAKMVPSGAESKGQSPRSKKILDALIGFSRFNFFSGDHPKNNYRFGKVRNGSERLGKARIFQVGAPENC